MEKVKKESTSKLLEDLIKLCASEKINFNITQEGVDLVIEYTQSIKSVSIIIPDPTDKRIPDYIKKCIKKIKATL